MKKLTKLTTMVVAVAMISSMTTPVFAATSASVDAGYYGTLTGEFHSDHTMTSVTKNVHEAKMYVEAKIIDDAGYRVDEYATFTIGQNLRSNHSIAHTVRDVYGTAKHEVSGKSSAVVYTTFERVNNN